MRKAIQAKRKQCESCTIVDTIDGSSYKVCSGGCVDLGPIAPEVRPPLRNPQREVRQCHLCGTSRVERYMESKSFADEILWYCDSDHGHCYYEEAKVEWKRDHGPLESNQPNTQVLGKRQKSHPACMHCGNQFYDHGTSSVFCSQSCDQAYDRAKGKIRFNVCDGCGIERKLHKVLCLDGEQRKYCSEKCAVAHQRGLGIWTHAINAAPGLQWADSFGRNDLPAIYDGFVITTDKPFKPSRYSRMVLLTGSVSVTMLCTSVLWILFGEVMF